MSNTISTQPEQQGLGKEGRKRIVVVLLTYVIGWAIIFIGAGTLRYPAAWGYVGFANGRFPHSWCLRHSQQS